MADKPIIFSAPMVRALLDGRKTQTRRILKPQPPEATRRFYRTPLTAPDGGRWMACLASGVGIKNYGTRGPGRRIPVDGDCLWVREAHWFTDEGDCVPVAENEEASADERKRPSIHMPRWASRLTLTVTDVRVQRVQEISEADARAEGAVPVIAHPNELDLNGNGSYRDSFRDLWNSIHGRAAWNENPWVAALTFDVHRCNIDADGSA